jgi:hypothetical protein
MSRFPNKYTPIPKENKSPVSISRLLLVVWSYTFILSLYFADEIILSLENYDHPITNELSSSLLIIPQKIPLSRWKNKINDAAQYLYQQEYRFGTNLKPAKEKQAPIIRSNEEVTNTYLKKLEIKPEVIEIPPPVKILLVGASSMHARMGTELSKGLKKISGLTIQRHAKLGTGLARPDVYNWAEITLELAKKHESELVIAQFIGNDCQSLILPNRRLEAKYGTAEWDKIYGQRIEDFIIMLQAEDIHVVLIGMPIVRSKRFRAKIIHVNKIVEKMAKKHDAIFIPLWDISTTSDGSYKNSIRKNGRTLSFRHDDGIHLSPEGSRQVATTIINELEKVYQWKENKLKENSE